MTPRTRAIVINSPHNPTGLVIDRDTLAGIVAVAERHGLWVLSGFGKWYRFSFEGEYLASAELPMEVFAKDPALAWD